jgi:hypothetical protein
MFGDRGGPRRAAIRRARSAPRGHPPYILRPRWLTSAGFATLRSRLPAGSQTLLTASGEPSCVKTVGQCSLVTSSSPLSACAQIAQRGEAGAKLGSSRPHLEPSVSSSERAPPAGDVRLLQGPSTPRTRRSVRPETAPPARTSRTGSRTERQLSRLGIEARHSKGGRLRDPASTYNGADGSDNRPHRRWYRFST